MGMHHIPHTEDLPVTPTVGNHLTFFLFPYNYFTDCPSMSSRDQVRRGFWVQSISSKYYSCFQQHRHHSFLIYYHDDPHVNHHYHHHQHHRLPSTRPRHIHDYCLEITQCVLFTLDLDLSCFFTQLLGFLCPDSNRAQRPF